MSRARAGGGSAAPPRALRACSRASARARSRAAAPSSRWRADRRSAPPARTAAHRGTEPRCHPGRKPHDGGDGTGELQLVADLRRPVVGDGQPDHAAPRSDRVARHAGRASPRRARIGCATASFRRPSPHRLKSRRHASRPAQAHLRAPPRAGCDQLRETPHRLVGRLPRKPAQSEPFRGAGHTTLGEPPLESPHSPTRSGGPREPPRRWRISPRRFGVRSSVWPSRVQAEALEHERYHRTPAGNARAPTRSFSDTRSNATRPPPLHGATTS